MGESDSVSQTVEPPGTGIDLCNPPLNKTRNNFHYSPNRVLAFIKTNQETQLLRPEKRSSITISPQTDTFRRKFFPGVTMSEWNDWRWQLRNRICSFPQLERFFRLSPDERKAKDNGGKTLPVAITPYYASLLNENDSSQSLRKTVIPVFSEKIYSQGEAADPLGEDKQCPAPGIVHRYPDRVLFLVTNYCASYCRYCTRSRMVGDSKGHYAVGKEQWESGIAYIESHPEVRDVLISGGDTLTLPDEEIAWLLKRLKKISHVEFLRIGTKVPVVLPQRITPALARILKRYHPLWLSIHFTHPEELTPETQGACERLADAGIPLGSQTVLLAGINDHIDTMKKLFHGLLKIRVKPYYLYQCDPILGSSHFRTPVQKGIEMISQLRGYTSGYAVPNFVIDAPGGGGKILIAPETIVGQDADMLLLRNYEGKIFKYPNRI